MLAHVRPIAVLCLDQLPTTGWASSQEIYILKGILQNPVLKSKALVDFIT